MEKKLNEVIRRIRFKNKIVVSDDDVKASFEKIMKRIESGQKVELPVAKRIPLYKSIQFRVAAAVAILFTVGFMGLNYYENRQMVTIANNSNDIREINLPDGTVISLRSNSVIHYRKSYPADRSIGLEGEALFNVTKNPSSPFVVNTPNGTVKVLGTIFSVRAFPAENFTRTLLQEGSVRFSDAGNNKSVLLKPGEEAQIDRGETKIKVRKVKDMDRALAWKTRSFSFEDETLEDILTSISGAFNKEIDFQQSNFKDKRFTLKFNHGEDLPKMLDILSDIGKFNYRIQDNQIVISQK